MNTYIPKSAKQKNTLLVWPCPHLKQKLSIVFFLGFSQLLHCEHTNSRTVFLNSVPLYLTTRPLLEDGKTALLELMTQKAAAEMEVIPQNNPCAPLSGKMGN